MPDFVVPTTSGQLRGRESDGAAVWRGIPYAAPPTGERRFLPPAPAVPWDGVRDATRFGAVAMQSRDPRIAMMSGINEKIAMSEDCLYLNVAAPADYATGPGRPVVVWIHGGAFMMGSGSTPLYRGEAFATDGVVCVTINYRLGLFGLLYLGHKDPAYAAGNACLLDQIAALAWVRDNISAFGGDPQRVTVMGESAGAMSIGALLAMPAARGLFHAAILESGAAVLATPTRADAVEAADETLAALGVTDVAQLVALPAETIMAAQFANRRGLAAFAPFVDGVSLPSAPIDAARDGTAIAVPMLCGTNRDEWTLFAVFLGEASIEPIRAALIARFGAEAMARLVALYDLEPGIARGWVDLVGDAVFRIPLLRLAEANRAPTFVYRFDWRSANLALGAAHALELPFVWSQLDVPASKFFLGGDQAAEAARPLAAAVHATWVAFIRDHVPEAGALPAWPAYELERRATMLIDATSRVVDDAGATTRRAWQQLL